MMTFEEKWCKDKRKLLVAVAPQGIRLSVHASSAVLTFILDPEDVGNLAAALWECSPGNEGKMEAIREAANTKTHTQGTSQAEGAEAPDHTEASQEGRGLSSAADSAAQG